jgi:hypothetical protein
MEVQSEPKLTRKQKRTVNQQTYAGVKSEGQTAAALFPQKTQVKMGRPSMYTPELAAEICARVSAAQSIRTITDADDMPVMSTVFRWLGTIPEFKEQYTRAMEERSVVMAEQLLEIADSSGDDVNRDKLRIETRKWIMSKMSPRFSDKRVLTHQNPDGSAINAPRLDPRELSDEVREALRLTFAKLVNGKTIEADQYAETEPEPDDDSADT